MSQGLVIPGSIADELMSHAHAEEPNEACGMLSGELASGRALAFHPARNAAASPLRYDVHPDDLVRIVFGIEDAGQDLLAIFHSHTLSPAVPSATDRREARYPGVYYLLASLADRSAAPAQALRAWTIEDGEIAEYALSIE